MAAGSNVGAELMEMLNNLKRYEKTTSSAGPQTTDLSFMNLLWPLLPLLPPEPPTVLIELLREPEKCDVCGTTEGTPLKSYTKTPTGNIKPIDTTSSPVRLRGASRTPLDRLMMDIENKMDETLNSIKETTEMNIELSQKANEIEKLQMSDMTDAELLKTLKKLTKVKADRMEKVKILEVKEQQLKESLINTIEWARSVDFKKGIPESEILAVERVAKERIKTAPQRDSIVSENDNITQDNDNTAPAQDKLPNDKETVRFIGQR